MAHLTPTALQHLATHHGIASTAVLEQCGLSRHDVRDLVEAHNLVAVLKGVYRSPAVPYGELSRCAAICASRPDLAIAGPTAGRLWGFRRLPPDRRVHVVAPPASQPTIAPWVRPYRTAAIHECDVVQRSDGIAITSRPRTALDLGRFVAGLDHLSVIEQAMKDGDHSEAEMRRVAADWVSPRRPWLRRYLEMLDRRAPGGPAESHHEVVLGDALVSAGVRDLVRQLSVELPGYGAARFDLAVPSARWAVEVDVFPTHAETAGRLRDSQRDAAAAESGWLVSRVVEADLGSSIGDTVRRLTAIYRRRRQSG